MFSVVKYAYKYVHTYMCNMHICIHVQMMYRYAIKKIQCLLGGGFTFLLLCKQNSCGKHYINEVTPSAGQGTFCRRIFWGFTALRRSGRGERGWLFPQKPFGFPWPCFCGSYTPFLGVPCFFSSQISAGFPYIHHGAASVFPELALIPVRMALLCVTC